MRARRLQFLGIVKDARGQALTEFAITMPVVLLFFLAMLQYFSIVQASQLGNYAAYVAARVYVVQAPLCKHKNGNDDDAKDKAKKAAAMALAPIARFVPGEISVGGFSMGSLSSMLPSGTPDFLQGAAKFVEGYLVAYYIRLNSSLGGGSLDITANDTQVDVSINYPQPIYIPGLAEMWNFVQGEHIFTSLKPVREGLGGIPSYYASYQELRDKAKSLLGIDLPDSPVRFLPYVNIKSKCSMGMEDWGSKEEYRPRQHGTVQDAGASEEDKNKINNSQKAQEAAQEYNKAVQTEKDKCSAWNAARTKLAQAQSNRDAVYANPNSTAQQKAAADAALSQAQQEEQAAHNAYNSAQADRRNKQATLEGITGESYDDLNCDT